MKRLFYSILCLSVVLWPAFQPASADMDPGEFDIPVAPVVRLGDLPASERSRTDAALSQAAAKHVLAEAEAKRRKLADDWGMEEYSAETVTVAPRYFVVRYSYRLLNLPSSLSGAARRYCALLFQREGSEWRAGACVRSPVNVNSRVLDINRDGRLDLIADRSMILGDLDKDGVPEVLPDHCRIIGDLNNDGVPELLSRTESDVRTTIEVHEEIMVWDSAQKAFTESGIFAYSWHDTNCPGGDEPDEKLTIDETAKPYPAIVLERKVVRVAKACVSRETISENADRYQWSPLFRAYVLSLTDLGGGSFSALDPMGRQEHRLLLSRKGSVKKLKNVFNIDTRLSGFILKNDFLLFSARDAEWDTDYAWQVERDKLHFRAKNRKTGRTVYSKPYSVNPFKQGVFGGSL